MTAHFNAAAAALSASRALVVARGTLADLRQWHLNTAGPKIALTTTTTGVYTVASQCDADALAGRTVTGRVEITASGGSASNPIRLRNFRVVGPATPSGSSVLIAVLGGASNIVIEDFQVDGANVRSYAGMGGTSYSNNVLVQRGDFTRLADDGAKHFRNSVFKHNFVHDLRPWNPATDGTYNPGTHPHLDCVQGLRGGSSIEENWLQNTTTATATSAILIKPDPGEDITTYLIRANYIEGSNNYPIQVLSKPVADGNGPAAVTTGVVIRDNLISRNYAGYAAHGPYSVDTPYADRIAFSGNVWADDRSPVPNP